MTAVLQMRGYDPCGGGHYGASRGTSKGRRRYHMGVDLCGEAGEIVVGLERGKVTRIGYPYSPLNPKKGHYRYVEVTVNNGDRWRYFYVSPLVDVGDVIERGQAIGCLQGLKKVYPLITDHYHFEIKNKKHKRFDPIPELLALGYIIQL